MNSTMQQQFKNRRAKFAKFAKELVENKDQWIGSQLIDSGDELDKQLGATTAMTVITDIGFDPKQDTFLWIWGEEFNCGVHVDYGSINEARSNDHRIMFHGYGNHEFQIRRLRWVVQS